MLLAIAILAIIGGFSAFIWTMEMGGKIGVNVGASIVVAGALSMGVGAILLACWIYPEGAAALF